MSSSCRKLYVALGAGALLSLGHGSAYADNWEMLPRIEGGGIFNDNYRLAEGSADKLQVYGPYIDAQLDAQLVSPNSKLQIVPRVHATYFPTDHEDQSTDGYLDVDDDYKTLRSEFTGVLQYSNQTVIYSELLPATFPGVALGQVVGGASGRVSINNREQLVRAVPSYTYDMTQRVHLNLGGEYDHASFSKSVVSQVGYDNYTAVGGLGFDVSPRSVLTVSGVGSRFLPQDIGHNTNTYGAQLQWDLQETQVSHFYARVGANRIAAQTAVGTVNENGITGGVGVELRYQITEFTIDALRALSPSDAGAVVVNNELRFRVLRALSPRFSGYLGVRGIQQRGSSEKPGLTIQGEDYIAAETGFAYQFTQSVRLEGKYYYTWQRFQGEPNADSNAVTLAIIYQPLSRYEPLPELMGIPQER